MTMQIIKKACPLCGKESFVAVPVDNYKKYCSGTYVQDAFPESDFTAEYREIIKSGMCKECQDDFFIE